MKNIKSLKLQGGMTGIGWMIVISLIAFFAYTIILLVPIYLENHSITSVVSDLADGDEKYSSASELRKTINKRFDINMTTSVKAADISISRDANVFLVGIDYEVREPFLGNIDLVFTFKSEVKVPTSNE